MNSKLYLLYTSKYFATNVSALLDTSARLSGRVAPCLCRVTRQSPKATPGKVNGPSER
jgi:hypothetical protein